MFRSKIILVLTVLLMLGAGFVLGQISARMQGGPPPGDRPPSWLADQLDLTADQRKQMDAIWGETKQKIGKTFEARRAIDKERDQAIVALLDDKQRGAYEQILDKAKQRRTALDQEREAAMRDANERSRALLNDRQKERWETLTQQMRAHDRHGRRGPDNRRSATMPGHGREERRGGGPPGPPPGERPEMPPPVERP
jgi:Spy/CpxP family protein refolding chaperone